MAIEKYIEFRDISDRKKLTKRWAIVNIKTQVITGQISWHGAWRKYCFFPEANMLFDPDCLHMIANFVELATTNHMLAVKWKKKLNL